MLIQVPVAQDLDIKIKHRKFDQVLEKLSGVVRLGQGHYGEGVREKE